MLVTNIVNIYYITQTIKSELYMLINIYINMATINSVKLQY